MEGRILKPENPAINPYPVIILAVVATAFSSIFTKLASAPPNVIAFYRLAFTVLLLTPLALNSSGCRELRRMPGRDLVMATLAGIFLALHFALWIASLRLTSVASSTVLVTMQPLFVITGGFLFFKEKITLRGLAGGAAALCGSVIIGLGDFQASGQAFWGDILALGGAFMVALYVLIGRSLRSRLSLFPYAFLVYGAAALFLLLINLASHTPLYPYPGMDWVWFLALAVVPTLGGHTVFNWALRYVKAAVVSVSTLGEPLGATLMAYFIFKEIPGTLQITGGLIIIIGLYVFITAEHSM